MPGPGIHDDQNVCARVCLEREIFARHLRDAFQEEPVCLRIFVEKSLGPVQVLGASAFDGVRGDGQGAADKSEKGFGQRKAFANLSERQCRIVEMPFEIDIAQALQVGTRTDRIFDDGAFSRYKAEVEPHVGKSHENVAKENRRVQVKALDRL